MNFYNKFLFFYFLIAFNVTADELTINISGQNKSGILNLAIYNNAEAYDRSVKGEGRSEGGFFSGIDSFIELKESHKFVINVPEGIYAIALFIDVNKNMKIFLAFQKNNMVFLIMLWERYLAHLLSKLSFRLKEMLHRI